MVGFRPHLTVSGGRLRFRDGSGRPVHAASFLNERSIVLEEELGRRLSNLRRILVHELFHFVWRRLGNPVRFSWEEVLAGEFRCGARGELGWSAEWRKKKLSSRDAANRSRRWREYVCESFCDTAAWRFRWGRHSEYTLAPRFCRARRNWFRALMDRGRLQI